KIGSDVDTVSLSKEIGSSVDADIPVKKSVLVWIPIFQEFGSSVDADIPDKAISSSGYQFRCGYQNPKENRLLLEYQIPKEFGSNVNADIPVKDTRISSDLNTNLTSKEIGSDMNAKIFLVRFQDEFNMAFRRFKTPSKYNRGLRYGMVDGFHFRLMDRISPFDFLLDGFPLTNWGFPPFGLYWMGGFSSSDFIGWVSPSDFIRSGFLRIFIRLGEDDGWMMDVANFFGTDRLRSD
ncbi:hypothetical protein RhiirB3_445821, partial [Rhizophagus irregularis]